MSTSTAVSAKATKLTTSIKKPNELPANQSTHSLESSTSSLTDSFSSMPSTPGCRSSISTTVMSTSDYYSQQQQHMLDHSHIKPGKDASLLSYAQTITMYRKNAKRTTNLDTQCEFAKFLIEASQQQQEDEPNKEYLSEAEKLLKQLSIKGHSESQYTLGKLYSMGLLSKKKGKPDWEKAFGLYVQASKHNHADAANRSAECYEKGYGCRVNGTKAVKFYMKAASLNHAGAMYRLGLAYINGDLGLVSNARDGIKWFSRSVEAITPEYPEALHELAVFYEQGIPNVVYVDVTYAVSLYEQAANMEYAPSAFRMGECFEYGKLNCQPDPALSIHYYTIAAEKGHREACFALTAWYLVGSPNILKQSDENAFMWTKRAAELELPKAEYAVGYFIETGIGCVKDSKQAAVWYNKAAEHGDKRALQRLQRKAISQTQNKPEEKKSSQDDCAVM